MPNPAPHELSIAQAGRMLRAGTITSTALTQNALDRIAALNPLLNAFVLVTRDRALADAARADQELKAGVDKGPLHGVPYGLKDIYETAGIRTTCHSKLLIDHVPAADCVVEQKLREGGAVLLGKLATHEFAIGGPSFDLPFPPARNPWNLEHFTGGSSSGSGAAVAADITRLALGSDTGGSIRGPAAYCGVVGLKPTYGLVSRRGVFPLSYTLDHAGPLTRSVEDAALTMRVIAGYDVLDPASANVPLPDFSSGLGRDLAGLRLALPRHFYVNADKVSPEVIAAVDAAAAELTRLGAVVDEVTLPDYDLFQACGRVILTAEAFAVHEHDLINRPLDYARFTYQRMMPGAALTAVDLVQAFRVRRELTEAVNTKVLGTYDAIITANALGTAPRFDEFPSDATVWSPIQTIPFNVTGNPVLAVPVGFSKSGLPLSMQIVGRAFDEPTILRIGAAYEAAAGWTNRRPQIEAAQSVGTSRMAAAGD
jgi:aspartyl-tRNA(Asn)/glutamyl-tRNA(Gln) amidotransferase subunit A